MDTDKNWLVIGTNDTTVTQTDYDALKLTKPLTEGVDDHVKGSQLENVTVDGITFDETPKPTENWIDFVRGKMYTIRNCIFPGGSGYGAITIKGAISGWLIDKCTITNGKTYGIEVGNFDNYWYPGRAPTRHGTIQDVNPPVGGAPVIVELWDSDEPVVLNSNVKIKRKSKFIWLPYFLIMYVVVRIKGAKTK